MKDFSEWPKKKHLSTSRSKIYCCFTDDFGNNHFSFVSAWKHRNTSGLRKEAFTTDAYCSTFKGCCSRAEDTLFVTYTWCAVNLALCVRSTGNCCSANGDQILIWKRALTKYYPSICFWWLWGKPRVPGGNPHGHGENTQDLLGVRGQCCHFWHWNVELLRANVILSLPHMWNGRFNNPWD